MCCSTGPRLLDNTFVMQGVVVGIIPCIPKNSLTLSSKKCFLKLSMSQTFCVCSIYVKGTFDFRLEFCRWGWGGGGWVG